MKTINANGLIVHIDRPKGYVQHGKDKDGKAWTRTYHLDYGYIKGTDGGDGEDLDVFIGTDGFHHPAYAITQRKDDGTFDEFKFMLGFASKEDAHKAYKQHIPQKFMGGTTTVPMEVLKALVPKSTKKV
jgi:hypothetical protein